jgi:HAD superfamily hydrolase (TIGR01509 family)
MSFAPAFAALDIHGVIFDMDGLLLDSERVALATVAAAAAEMGIDWPPEVGLAMVGLNSKDGQHVIRRHLGDDFPVDQLYEHFGRIYEARIMSSAIPLMQGVTDLFDVLDTLALGRVVATSTRRSRAEPKLAAAGLLGRVHGMVCGDEVSRGKPAPDIFLKAAERLGVPVANCLVLEDSNAGVRGALAAGARVVMVPDLLAPADDVRAAGVPLAGSLHDLAGFLAGRAA